MVLDQEQYCCPRDLWKCLQTLLVITTGRRVLLVFNGQKPGTLLIIPQYKGQPHNKEMPIKPRLRNWFRSFFSTGKLGKVFFGKKNSIASFCLILVSYGQKSKHPGICVLNRSFVQMEMFQMKTNLLNITACVLLC